MITISLPCQYRHNPILPADCRNRNQLIEKDLAMPQKEIARRSMMPQKSAFRTEKSL
jgi:hypothetical protein